MSEFCKTRNIAATRKLHRCEGCGKAIEAGQHAFYFALKDDGQFYDGHYHPDCREAEEAFNDANDRRWDEWTALSCISGDREDAEWLIENRPLIAARLGLKVPA